MDYVWKHPRNFSERNHSTIMHAFRKMELLLSEKASSGKYAAEQNKIQELEQRLNSALACEINFVGAVDGQT